jgi:hypothetical protein
VSALEPPLERVNYFNGQRLEAADFRADQNYQMRVRRMLNSAFYSPGIVRGLEVTPHPTDKHKVVVAPGVALDVLGREIILLDATPVQVAGAPTPASGAVFGNFLAIAYAEERVQPVTDGCATVATAKPFVGDLAWGAPTRIRATPDLAFVDTWPADQSGKIVLAQVALTAGCQVASGGIQSGVRKYAVPARPPTTRVLSLEGEKDIDANNPKSLYFHVEGDPPAAVTLYLRAARFSTLFYTELGKHTHDNTPTLPALSMPAHSHTLTNVTTASALDNNTLQVMVQYFETANAGFDEGFLLTNGLTALLLQASNPMRQQADMNAKKIIQIPNSSHSHGVSGSTDPYAAVNIAAGQSIAPNNAPAGVTDQNARSNVSSLSYVDTLKVLYDGQDITALVLAQLAGNDPTNWPAGSKLGDGTGNHALVKNGTGAIDLLQLGLDFTAGQHSLTFEVATGGGQVQYNLYVE